MPNSQNATAGFTPGPAAQSIISLSQAILAPLDAVFKAQVHAARSFLNLVMQLGYPHWPVDNEGKPLSEEELRQRPEWTPEKIEALKKLYTWEFYHEVTVDGRPRKQKITIPTLALVPVAPLAVESAEFKFDMTVSRIERHNQIQRSEADSLQTEKEPNAASSRPWFLVPDPISIRGAIAPKAIDKQPGAQIAQEVSDQSTIHIEIKVGSIKMPAALDKLLTALTQTTSLTDVP